MEHQSHPPLPENLRHATQQAPPPLPNVYPNAQKKRFYRPLLFVGAGILLLILVIEGILSGRLGQPIDRTKLIGSWTATDEAGSGSVMMNYNYWLSADASLKVHGVYLELGAVRQASYTGTWSLQNSCLQFEYNDGKAHRTMRIKEISADGRTMHVVMNAGRLTPFDETWFHQTPQEIEKGEHESAQRQKKSDDLARQQDEQIQRTLADVNLATKPGTFYQGQIQGSSWVGGSFVANVAINFTDSGKSDDVITGILTSRDHPELQCRFTGSIEKTGANQTDGLPIVLKIPHTNQNSNADVGKMPFFFNESVLKLRPSSPNALKGIMSVGGAWGDFTTTLNRSN